MEQNKILIIAIVSAILGGIIGGGISYIMINPSIERLDQSMLAMEQSLITLEEVVGVNTDEIKEKTESMQTSLLGEIDSIGEDLVGLESMDSSLIQRIDTLQTQMEQQLKEPKFHLTFQDRLTNINSDVAVTNQFELKGNYTHIYYNIYVENTGTSEYYYNWLQINVYNKLGSITCSLFLEGNDHYNKAEQFVGILPLNIVPDTYYIELKANTKNIIWNYNLSIWDYY